MRRIGHRLRGTAVHFGYERIGRIQTLLGSLFYMAMPAGLIFIQPDMSTAIVLDEKRFLLTQSLK